MNTTGYRFTAYASGLLAISLVVGCKTMPIQSAEANKPEVQAAKRQDPASLIPPPSERIRWPDVNQDELNNRARGYGLVKNPELEKYLNGLYQKIKDAAKVPEWPGKVHIVASDGLSAHASGAGNLYLALPWLMQAESDDEIVALLAHEFSHVYLHFHRLDRLVVEADKATSLGVKGLELAAKGAQSRGWTNSDSLGALYALSRAVSVGLYSQSEEFAADAMALALSHRLGYSYEFGIKAMLERIASREEVVEKQAKKRREDLARAQELEIRKQAEVEAKRGNMSSQVTAEVTIGLNRMLAGLGESISSGVAPLTHAHPETQERIERVAKLADQFQEFQQFRPANLAGLDTVRAEPTVQALLENYRLSFEVLADPAGPDADEKAKRIITGPTAAHAVPLFAAYVHAQAAAAKAPSSRGRAAHDLGQLLDANIRSESDRSWIVIRERADMLLKAGRRQDAHRFLDEGLKRMQFAEEALPDYIRRVGVIAGWTEAKKAALTCGQSHKRMAQRCLEAAQSPEDLRRQEQLDEQKADDLLKRLNRRK